MGCTTNIAERARLRDRSPCTRVRFLRTIGLRRVLKDYVAYYTASRTHLALEKDSPVPRAVAPPAAGRIIAIPQVSGLHHRYERRAA